MRKLLAAALALLVAAPAHAGYFGKNKVQYRAFHWQVLETPHFEILFYDREAAVVQDAARLAERAYGRLATVLQHEFSHRIPVILYASHSDFQQTNITESFIDVGTGGVTDLLRRRVFLPFTGSYAELQHVLTHELTHAFELDILYDPHGTRDPLRPLAFAPPLWVMEGLAEYLSRGGEDRHTDMWVRDACLAGNLPSIEQLAFANDIRVYRFGQSVWQFFGSEYGDDHIGPLLLAMRDQKSLDRALKQVAKTSLAEFSDRWRMAMRRRSLPGIATQKAASEFAAPVVTRRDEAASLLLGATLSPDGARLAYISNRRLNHELYVRALDGDPRPRRLVEGETSGDFESLRFFNASTAWSPDGATLAFSAKSGGEDALYLLDAATGDVRARLTFGLDEVQTASFSPDGQEIVFVGLAGGQSDLYRVRRDGSDLRRLTQDRYAERDPQWSPDGSSIVYVGDEGPETDLEALRFGRMHLLRLDLETGARRDITPFATGKAVSPSWSGDGEHLAFVSDQDGTSNIYVLHLPTGRVFRLSDSATGVSGILPTSPALAWAQQRDRLVFSAFSDSGWDVYRIDDALARLQPVEPQPGTLVAVVDSTASPEVRLAAADGIAAAAVLVTADAATAPGAGPSGTDAAHGFRVRDYKAHLAPDLSNVGGMVGYDSRFAGQSQLQFSDLLGNYDLTVGLGIYGSLKESDLFLSFLDRSGRINWSVAAFQFRRRYATVGHTPGGETSRQTYRGLQVTAIRPFDKFSRLEASLRLAGVQGRFYLGETEAEVAADERVESMRTFVGPGVAYVLDSALYGYAGPIKGRRLRLSCEAGVGQLDYATLEVDLRQYWNFEKWYTLAGRFYAASSHGPSPQTVYLGGAQSLRGYDYGALLGNHAALGSVEFRFPLVRHLALGWPLPLEFGYVEGVLFGDGATAWDGRWFRTSRAVRGESAGRAPLLAAGFGMRFNLGYLVLKLDWAQLHDTGTGRRAHGSSIALGTDF